MLSLLLYLLDWSPFCLPVLLSAVFVFIASCLLHVVFPHHRHDYQKLPDEDSVSQALVHQRVQPGQYFLPHCGSDPGNKEWQERVARLPSCFLWVAAPGSHVQLQTFISSFLFNVLVSAFVAFVLSLARPATLCDGAVLAAVVAAGFYSLAFWWDVVWTARAVVPVLLDHLDAVVYGAATALAFFVTGSLPPVPSPVIV
eukprot:gnl/Spiro4/21038_TR10264_c0_g1_i1.p1 gnl/Spiro4/21038_TR10264_c0_g1~~gnl/Spiro4/21038_TR10264_c0_g1_i1.p1  ORF type:complete len:211 (-),score=70.16 gnl/Spiro4/21038_TR10264_c0_g1_i1:51-647(-)